MRQIRVHLDHVVVQLLPQNLLHPIAASGAKSSLTRPRQKVNARIGGLETANFAGGPVGRIVVHEQDRLVTCSAADPADQRCNIIALVVGGDDQHEMTFSNLYEIGSRVDGRQLSAVSARPLYA